MTQGAPKRSTARDQVGGPTSPMRALAAIAACGVMLGAWACKSSGTPTAEIRVLSHTPSETRTEPRETIQLQFDRPVADEGDIGKALTQPPIALTPKVEFVATWKDRQTLVATPSGDLTPSTRYQVKLIGDLGERTAHYSFSFINQPLEVEGVFGVPLERLSTTQTLPIRFNQPVRAGDVVKHCDLRGNQGGPLTTKDANLVATLIEVSPTKELLQGTDYTLVCEGLSGAGGDAPMAVAFSQGLRTYPKLSIATFSPAGNDVPADDVVVSITFANPIDVDSLRKSMTSKPEIPGLVNGSLDGDGTTYRALVNLKVQTDYRIEFGKQLTDVFGQALAEPYIAAFHTGDARPRLSLETGIYAVEPTAAGYPVWSRSVGQFVVDCAEVPRKQVVALLTGDFDYDPWYEASNLSVDWSKYGLKKKTKRFEIPDAKNNWHLENLAMSTLCGDGGANPKGIYLAAISSTDVKQDPNREWMYRPSRRVLANVTDLGVLLKAGPASGLVWVTSLSTGKPVAGASVEVYSPKGERLWQGRSNQSGIAELPGSSKLLRSGGDEYDEYSYRPQRLIALVSKGDDLAAVDGNWANGIQIWNFGVEEDRRGAQTRIRGLIQSDRGVYRPGETVHFKGLAREIAIGRSPEVPRQSKVAITVEDSRGATVLEDNLTLTRFGGFSFDLPLTEWAPTGDYRVVAKIESQTFHETFQVEEFRKVTFEVGLSPSTRHGELGDKLVFEGSADYLFGAPLKNAKVHWTLQRRSHTLSFERFPGYGFVDWAAKSPEAWWYEDDAYLSYVTEGEQTTGGDGTFRFEARDADAGLSGPQDYLAQVQVTDESDQTVSKQVVMTAHPSDHYLGLHTQEFVQAVDMPFAVNTVALTPEGKQVAATAKLSFIKQTWDCSHSGGYMSYSTCTTKHYPVFERTISIPASGNGSERILPKEPGEYVIRLDGTDKKGRKISSSSYVWVIGRGQAFWSGDEDARMSLVSSKKKYQVGEDAKLVAVTSLPSPTALVTVERNGILSARVIEMESASEGITLPITDDYGPNVFASVAMVSGRQGEGDRNRPRFKMGVVELEVSSEAHRMNVAIKTDRETYEPGDTVSGEIVLTAAGEPVVGEIALSVADEGVLQLIAYQTPDPMKAFFATWGLGVDSSTNWNRISRINDPTGEDNLEEGGDAAGSRESKVRSKFVSSAYWAPHLVTDESGVARFTFTAPDNLTAFRLMAVAADSGSMFGSSDKRITIKKPLLAKPVLPRFVGEGDQVEVGVLVHNYSGQSGTAQITAKATGATLKKATQSVTIADGDSTRVRFPAVAKAGEQATFEFAVTMGSHQDALRIAVPIERGLVIDKKTLARGVLAEGDGPKQMTVPVAWDTSVVRPASELVVTIDRTGLAELEPSLKYLVEYPYGCLEQTLSRFVPLAKVKDLSDSLNIPELAGDKTKRFLEVGAAKVVRHQDASGHFSLWPNSQPYPHLTVYAVYGLHEAKRAGVTIDDRALSDGVAAMRRWATSPDRVLGSNTDSGTVAMAAHLMAEMGQADSGLNARLYEARQSLPRYGQAFLLMALHKAKAKRAQITTLTDELTSALGGGQAVILRETLDQRHVMGSDTRSTAILLSALLRVAPDHKAIDRLAAGLKEQQLPSGRWRNTQDNMHSLVALADYARARTAGNAKVSVAIGDTKLITRNLQGGKPLVLRRKLSAVEAGELTIESSDRVLYTVRVAEARKDAAQSPLDDGLTVSRQYLDPDTKLPVTSPKAGDVITVRLNIKTAEDRHYVAVRDRLPAGFEPLNSRIATDGAAAAPSPEASKYYSWTPPLWVYADLRDEGAQVFSDFMRAGDHVYEYNVRATIPGVFAALPAEAEVMYEPEIRGRTARSSMTIRP